MHTWHWQHWQNQPYLTCSLLAPWSHGFFTQKFWPQVPDQLIAALQPEAQVYRIKQVHGCEVLTPSEVEQYQAAEFNRAQFESGDASSTESVPYAQADGMLTEAANQAVWVCSADCTPVLIADAVTNQVSAVHAGWRGTAQRIVPQAIQRLQEQGSQIENLLVAMGPAIAGDVYQVSTDVAAEVGATVATSDDPLAELMALENAPILPDPEPDKVRLDVRRVNALQLEQLGLQPEQIAIAPFCTYQQPDHFFSYRRSQQKKVQWSGIVSQ